MARPTRGRGGRLRKTWSSMSVLSPTAITTTQSILGSMTVAAGGGIEATILRCRGQLLCSAVPDAGTDQAMLALGLMVITSSALAVGGVSVPGPIEDVDSDSWLWHRYVPFDAIAAASGIDRLGSLVERVEIDAKAMRRVPEDSALALVGQIDTSLFVNVTVSGGMRVLLGV